MPEPAGSGVLWRMGNVEKRLDVIESYTGDIPVIRRDIESLRTELADIREELKNNKRATWAVFLAIFGVGLSLTANVIAGSIG